LQPTQSKPNVPHETKNTKGQNTANEQAGKIRRKQQAGDSANRHNEDCDGHQTRLYLGKKNRENGQKKERQHIEGTQKKAFPKNLKRIPKVLKRSRKHE